MNRPYGGVLSGQAVREMLVSFHGLSVDADYHCSIGYLLSIPSPNIPILQDHPCFPC